MEGRGFCVKFEIDLQAVTCPGVWLCPNGKVALCINSLNSKVESHRLAPAFPLIYHEKFKFRKLFTGVSTLAELQSSLEEEFLYAELVQWSSPKGKTILLATFETNLAELLYPPSCSKGLLAGSDVDLLMEPTKYFPGILAPKIEVSTRTTIEEVTAIIEAAPGALVINPKTLNSKNGTCLHRKKLPRGVIRQRKVCHTQGKSRTHGNSGPRQRHLSPEGTSSSLSSASNDCSQTQIEQCYHKSKGTCSSARNSTSKTCQISPFRNGPQHMFDNCPLCSKYTCYFSHNREERARSSNSIDERNSANLHKACESSKCSRHFYVDDDKWRPKSAPHENSIQNSSVSSVLKSKVKEFQRQDAKLNHTAEDSRIVDYFECEKDTGRHGFYKNLEKFYKRMYKQAKIRAQEVDCS